MQRRTFLRVLIGSTVIGLGLTCVQPALAAPKRFVFKIRTTEGKTITGIFVEAKDMETAKEKLKKRYPGCTILEAKEEPSQPKAANP